ncbi:Purine-cytosine permease [Burkholderia sp. OK233]|nr:Purine-cytosine permease [Burkholderia sp. OK233]
MKNDYSTSPVPDEQTVSGWRIAMILMGVIIALPAFAMGAQLAHTMGARGALASSLLGGMLLSIIAMLAAVAGARSRLSSYVLIVEAFGTRGGALANGILAFSLLGWFAVIAMLFGHAMQSSTAALLPGVPAAAWAFAGAILMTVTAAVGFRALDVLSLLSTPLKIGLLLVTFWISLKASHTDIGSLGAGDGTALGTGISMVAGGLMVGAVLAPDICRFARTPMHGAFGVFVAYGIGFPLVLTLSGLPSVVTGQADLVAIMTLLGMGLPALLIILLSAWVTNGYNLYASSLVLATLSPRRSRAKLACFAGALGTVFGLLGIGDSMVPYLLVLSIAIPPIAGVYLSNFYLSGGKTLGTGAQWRPEALAAWLAGTGFAGLAQLSHWSVTGIPALDSLLLSVAVYFALRWFQGRSFASRQA